MFAVFASVVQLKGRHLGAVGCRDVPYSQNRLEDRKYHPYGHRDEEYRYIEVNEDSITGTKIPGVEVVQIIYRIIHIPRRGCGPLKASRSRQTGSGAA